MSQHLEALALAQEIRLGRARIKREVKAGERSVADVLGEIDEIAGGMPLRDLLLAVQGLGGKKVDQVIKDCQVKRDARVADIGLRTQRELIAKVVERYPATGRRLR